MILEKNRVYKIFHGNSSTYPGGWRKYIICSPREDVCLDNVKNGQVAYKSIIDNEPIHYIPFACNFVVCFDGAITITGKDVNSEVVGQQCESGYFEDCTLGELDEKDLDEVKEAMYKLNAKYNRKLNKIIFDA